MNVGNSLLVADEHPHICVSLESLNMMYDNFSPFVFVMLRWGLSHVDSAEGEIPWPSATLTLVVPLVQRILIDPEDLNDNCLFTPTGSYWPKAMLEVETTSQAASTDVIKFNEVEL